MEQMPKHKRRAVEDDLRRYRYYKALYEGMRDEIIYSSNHEVKGMPRGGEQVSVTESKAIALVSQLKHDYIAGIVRCIERTFASLELEEQEFVRLKYFEGKLTDEGVMDALHVTNHKKYYRMKNSILALFGFALGYWYSL